ncbi:MAG: FAD-dependent oxidoreductase [Clostridia bacterium]|nr:FAD-dependent oxidoreductase [Clostridia bacterium]
MYDVVVIGGGTAGISAAIASSMLGAKTLVVEKSSMLGGTMTAGGVNYPGLFFANGKQIIAGPCYDLLLNCGMPTPPTEYPKLKHYLGQTRFNIFSYVALAEKTLLDLNAEILYHTSVCKIKDGKKCVKLTLSKKQGLATIETKCLIDATGDANAVSLAGFKVEKRQTLQPATLINNLDGFIPQNIDKEKFIAFAKEQQDLGNLKKEDTQGGNYYDHLMAKRISMHVYCPDTTTSEGKSQLEISARQTLNRIINVYRQFNGLENLHVKDFAFECGVRESATVIGEYKTTTAEYLSGKVYKDSVCYAYYPIDEHLPTGIKKIHLEDGITPTIPYSSLIPKGSKRILVAGKIISAEPDVTSAIRVQAPCMATGQVAGVSAALCSKNNCLVKKVNLAELKEKLKNIGAIVP